MKKKEKIKFINRNTTIKLLTNHTIGSDMEN